MPNLTIRSFAELLDLPAHAQARILAEQKYPKQGPQFFKTPYYQQALSGIRSFYRAGNDLGQLSLAASRIEGFQQEAKRDNNLRVLNSFKASTLAKRKLQVGAAKHLSFKTNEVVLRISTDINGNEDGKEKLVMLHCRAQPLDPDLARKTLELVHWGLERAGSPVGMQQLEYFDLFTGTAYSISSRRKTTISAAEQSVKIIQAIWPTPLERDCSAHRPRTDCWIRAASADSA